MQLPTGIRDNLHFLLAETDSQVANLQVLLETASSVVAERILERRGYARNLKMRIHDECVDTLRRSGKNGRELSSLRAAQTIASGLDRLTSICHDSVLLIESLSVKRKRKIKPGIILLKDVARGIAMIEKALEDEHTRVALKLGQIERRLDSSYRRTFSQHLNRLGKTKHPADVVTALFLEQRIHQMGDVLRSISESIVSARLGHTMNIDRYRALESALSGIGVRDAAVEHLAHTQSGSAISGISTDNCEKGGYLAVYKDGKKDKLSEEWENVESWHEIFPGLAPQILAYNKRGKHASLLIEHLPGATLQQVVLHEDDALLNSAMGRLRKTLRAVWSETKRAKSAPAGHIHQLRRRLRAVMQVHPEFDRQRARIGETRVRSLDELLQAAERLEKKFKPVFSVYIHGDFNLDNIIFDQSSKSIRFIDLHRSSYQDYVQDVAVFMVSNFRLQVVDTSTRRRIQEIATEFYRFARTFAKDSSDDTFEIRLALGLARSFITSTRFILDKALATSMYLRGIYVLERLYELNGRRAQTFELPIKVLFT